MPLKRLSIHVLSGSSVPVSIMSVSSWAEKAKGSMRMKFGGKA